jgi:carboxypeptidase Q
MEFGAGLGALADGIGPRLTGSPNMAKANAWTRDTLTKIGFENAHLEDWGEFGMGWQQINTWARMVSPDPEPLWMQAAPWSPATKGPVTGEVVYVNMQDEKDLDKYKGKLAGQDRAAGSDAAYAGHHRAAVQALYGRRVEGDGDVSASGGRFAPGASPQS